ncbi:MAG: hypothetical protein U0838_04805 [Chloroflexota bacterium]
MNFLTVPLAIGFLGVDRYGVLVTLSSLAGMLVFADFGLGNGLLNIVSDANGRDDRTAAATAISSAAVLLTSIAACLGFVLLVAIPRLDWSSLLHVEAAYAPEVLGSAFVAGFAVVLGLPLAIVDKTRLGYQEGMANAMATLAGALLSLAAISAALVARAGLPVVVAAIMVVPLAASILNGYELFRVRRPWAMPSVWRFSGASARGLARVGTMFLILQLAIAVAYQSDIAVAAALFGPEAAATYAVTLKLAMLAPTLVGIYLLALWPAYGEALARGDLPWVHRALRRSILVAAGLAGASGVGLVLAGEIIIGIWTGGEVKAPLALLIGAALWALVSAVFNAVAMLLNAANAVAFQSVASAVMATASIILSITLGRTFGLPGIVWGTLVAYLAFSAIPVCVYLPRLLRSLASKAANQRHGALA